MLPLMEINSQSRMSESDGVAAVYSDFCIGVERLFSFVAFFLTSISDADSSI
jgi:hypothetical protein